MITQAMIDRINALAKKQKAGTLTQEEKNEQAALRKAYIDAYRSSLEQQLDHTTILRPDGTKEKLTKKS